MAEYIEIPENLDYPMLERLLGHDVVVFYRGRLEQRTKEGRIYHNPPKTIYLWATKDKKTNQGFYSSYRGYSRGRRRRNYGGS